MCERKVAYNREEILSGNKLSPREQFLKNCGLTTPPTSSIVRNYGEAIERHMIEHGVDNPWALHSAHQMKKKKELQRLAQLGLTVYTKDGLRKYLKTPLPTFQNKTARQLISARQIDEVIAALAGDYEGIGF